MINILNKNKLRSIYLVKDNKKSTNFNNSIVYLYKSNKIFKYDKYLFHFKNIKNKNKYINFLNNFSSIYSNNLIIKNYCYLLYKYMEKNFDIEILKQNLNKLNLPNKTVIDILSKTKYAERVFYVLEKTNELHNNFYEDYNYDKNQNIITLVLFLAQKINTAFYHRLSLLLEYILNQKITSNNQLESAINYLKSQGNKSNINTNELEEKSGIGIEVSEDKLDKSIRKILESKLDLIKVERYRHNFMAILYDLKKEYEYIDAKQARIVLLRLVEEILGGKTNHEKEEELIRNEFEDLKQKKKKIEDVIKKQNKLKSTTNNNNIQQIDSDTLEEELKNIKIKSEIVKNKIKEFDEEFNKKLNEFNAKNILNNKKSNNENNSNKEEEVDEQDKLSKISGRDMLSSLNNEETLKSHLEFTKGKIFTRFPPEPNGFLHIGHAKAMRFSFTAASKNGGYTYLRFDDTNPEKENTEFIESIKENVKFLGYTPYKITHSSDYFEELYSLAVKLIKLGKAFVCNLSKEKLKEERDLFIESPYRNRSVEENLELFEKMRQGRFDEKDACLRLKIDMKNPNPTLRDPVVYRIKYLNHPHVGDKWCIYPMYDFTHCICDSLENVTHSLCTLEFEVRRELYFWILEALNMYRPIVWEYSRLNVTNTVLSKRNLTYLVEQKKVRGWNDPRLLTINGLRRRGYTAEIINHFVDSIGVTRRGNENIISYKVLENSARVNLDTTAPRTMAVLDPLEVKLINFSNNKEIKVPLFPKNKDKGEKTITLSNIIYIERKDFKESADKDFFGLALNQEVGLKYAGYIKVSKVNKDNNYIKSIECEYFKEEKKTKSRIHWISDYDKFSCEIRWYNLFFKSEKPKDLKNWVDDINPDSEIIYSNSLVNNNILNKEDTNQMNYQFERIGYFVYDIDTDVEKKKYVFNLTVKL